MSAVKVAMKLNTRPNLMADFTYIVMAFMVAIAKFHLVLQVSLLQFDIPDIDMVDFAYAALDFMESIDVILEDNDLEEVAIVILKAEETDDGITYVEPSQTVSAYS